MHFQICFICSTFALVGAILGTFAVNIEPMAAIQPGRILVVDDSDDNRLMLHRLLINQGHEVEIAEDGVQALEKMHSQNFDAVLLDVMMPNMDGYVVLEKMKEDERLRNLPVIMISAVDAVESVIRCIQNGAMDYLPKPFNREILKARLESCLERKRHRDEEAALMLRVQLEKERSDALLRVILPEPIVEELEKTNSVKPRRYENVAMIFCDVVGFTSYCDKAEPEEVVSHLQDFTVACEEIALKHGIQKIKTIGDAFMGAAGLLVPMQNSVLNCARCGLEIVSASRNLPAKWEVRVGIHQGPVMAGVVGQRQYLFDVWGDTVNTAQRVESQGAPGSVNISAAAWEKIAACCKGQSLGLMKLKGKGEVEIFRVFSAGNRAD